METVKMYRNPKTGETYTEGSIYVTMLPDGTLYTGVPTEAELQEFGFGPYVPPVPDPAPAPVSAYRERMEAIKAELASMDYLTAKAMDGEDMSKYGDWQGRRRALRAEYDFLENLSIQ